MPETVSSLLIDTNVWLDCFLPGRKNREASLALMEKALDQGTPLFYTAGIAKDVFYLVSAAMKRKAREQMGSLSEGDARAIQAVAWGCVGNMRDVATAVGADESDLWLACEYRSVHGDLEDNLLIAAVRRSSATYLVTNDQTLLRHAPIAVLSSQDALRALYSGK